MCTLCIDGPDFEYILRKPLFLQESRAPRGRGGLQAAPADEEPNGRNRQADALERCFDRCRIAASRFRAATRASAHVAWHGFVASIEATAYYDLPHAPRLTTNCFYYRIRRAGTMISPAHLSRPVVCGKHARLRTESKGFD